LAKEIGRSSSQVALNWLRHRKAVVIPIIGARRAAQVEDNLKSLDWRLTDEQLAKLDEATKIELGFPHDFLTMISSGRWFSAGPMPTSTIIAGESDCFAKSLIVTPSSDV
jgi:Aldo/keto reductase family